VEAGPAALEHGALPGAGTIVQLRREDRAERRAGLVSGDDLPKKVDDLGAKLVHRRTVLSPS